MQKKILILLIFFLAIVFIFTFWVSHLNNNIKVAPVENKQAIKTEDSNQKIFNTDLIEQQNQGDNQEGNVLAI